MEAKTEELIVTERRILFDLLERNEILNTEVTLYRPRKFKNPLPEEEIGVYRPINKKKAVIADTEIIEAFIEKFGKCPSFLEAGPRKFLYYNPKEVKVGITTPGGLAPGINAAIYHLCKMLWWYNSGIEIYGFLEGFRGLIDNQKWLLTPELIEDWVDKGGTELGASRERPDFGKIAQYLQKNGINILFVIGGDGSMTAAHLLYKEIEKQKLEIRDKKISVVGIPRTIDNDILWVWWTLGFATAIEDAAETIDTLLTDTKGRRKIRLIQLFGRYSGFLAALATLASKEVNITLIPEVKWKIDKFLDYIKGLLEDQGYAHIVLSESAAPIEYKEPEDQGEIDSEKHEISRERRLQFIYEKIKERFGNYKGGKHPVDINRPRHYVASHEPNSVDKIFAQRLALLAVHNALAGFTDCMISQWLTEYVLVPLVLLEQKDKEGKRIFKKLNPGGITWKAVLEKTGQPLFI